MSTTKLVPFFLALFFSLASFAKNPPAKNSIVHKKIPTYSAEDLFRVYQPAVVKITILQEQIPIATGTGFFISKDGELLTNYHVIKDVLRPGSFSAQFAMSDGRVITTFQYSKCNDEREIDLCLLKLPVHPLSHFVLNERQPIPGETVYAIGHPQGLDFSITNGIVSAVRMNAQHVREVQISAAINPGNSGGPIFNSHAELVGIASKIVKDGQNLNFGIQSAELAHYVQGHASFISLTEQHRGYSRQIASVVSDLKKQETDVIYDRLHSKKPLMDDKLYHDVTIDLGADSFTTSLPKAFSDCHKIAPSTDGELAFSCSAFGDSAFINFSRSHLKIKKSITALNGSKISDEVALPIVEHLRKEGKWTSMERTLSDR